MLTWPDASLESLPHAKLVDPVKKAMPTLIPSRDILLYLTCPLFTLSLSVDSLSGSITSVDWKIKFGRFDPELS